MNKKRFVTPKITLILATLQLIALLHSLFAESLFSIFNTNLDYIQVRFDMFITMMISFLLLPFTLFSTTISIFEKDGTKSKVIISILLNITAITTFLITYEQF